MKSLLLVLFSIVPALPFAALFCGVIDIDRNDQAEFEAEYWGKIAKRMAYVEEVEKQPEMQQIRKLVKQLANRGYIVEARVK